MVTSKYKSNDPLLGKKVTTNKGKLADGKCSIRETCATISGLIRNEQLMYRNVNIVDKLKVSINKRTVVH